MIRPKIGTLPPGARNTIADLPGVSVGHATLAEGGVQTGVTMIRPRSGDMFRAKLPAASVVINELGQIETPIALTNTLSVGTVGTALIRRAIQENPQIGRRASTVNPAVFECNDGPRRTRPRGAARPTGVSLRAAGSRRIS